MHRPGLLVLEFSGNSVTAVHARRGRRAARDRLRALARRTISTTSARCSPSRDATRTTVVWATAPPVSPTQFPSNYPRALAAAIRKLAATNAGLRVVDTGAALTTDGRTFARDAAVPARRGGVLRRRPHLVARSDDGLHFDCHGVHGPARRVPRVLRRRPPLRRSDRRRRRRRRATTRATSSSRSVAPFTIPNGPGGPAEAVHHELVDLVGGGDALVHDLLGLGDHREVDAVARRSPTPSRCP